MLQRFMRWLAGSQGEPTTPIPPPRLTPRRFGALLGSAVCLLALCAVSSLSPVSAAPASSQIEGPQFEGATTEVAHVTTCLAENGRVDTNIVNRGDEPAVYRIEFEGLTPRESLVEPGDWWRMPITGRADADYDVAVTRRVGGGAATTVSSTSVSVRCDSSPPQVDEPEVQVVNACRNGDGYILFQFANDTSDPAGYVIEFDGVTAKVEQVANDHAELIRFTVSPPAEEEPES